MESQQTNIQKTFQLINQLTGNVTFITIKVMYHTSTRSINISKAISDIHFNDITKRLYVHIGTFPFPKQFQLLLKFQLFLETTIKLRFRKISNPNSPKNQKKQLAPPQLNKRTRKQKTIQQVQQLVSRWRNLYQSIDQNGKRLYTLDTAAQKLGIQKKTLDDYYYKIKNAHSYGFDFEKYKNQKIGVLRQFVRESKKIKPKQIVPTQVFNQWLNVKPNNGMNGGFQHNNGSGLGGTSYASSSYQMSYPPQKPSEDDIDKYFNNDDESCSSSDSQQSE